MPHNIVMRRVEVISSYRPLSDRPLVVSAEIGAPPTNQAPVYFRGDQGDDIAWPVGSWHFFQGIDLSEVYVKGSYGDTVTIIGGTWRGN